MYISSTIYYANLGETVAGKIYTKNQNLAEKITTDYFST